MLDGIPFLCCMKYRFISMIFLLYHLEHFSLCHFER